MFKDARHYLKRADALRVVLPALFSLLLFAGVLFYHLLPAMEQSLVNQKRQTIRLLCQAAASTLEPLEAQVQAGELTLDQAKAIGLERIISMHFGQHGTYWAINEQGIFLAHPQETFIGQNVLDIQGPNGNYLFREVFRDAMEHGQASFQFPWLSSDDPPQPIFNMAYVERFEPFGWLVGGSTRISDVTTDISHFRRGLIASSLAILLVITLLTAYMVREAIKNARRRERVEKGRKKLMRAMAEGEERYRTVADFTNDWEMWIGTEGEMLYCSPSCERMTGYPPERFFKEPSFLNDIVHRDDSQAWKEYYTDQERPDGALLDYRIVRKDGQVAHFSMVSRSVFGRDGSPRGHRHSVRDITHRKIIEEQLRHQALHDPLTALPNRTLALDRVRQVMERAKRRDHYFYAVVFMDLDRFKIINDSLGHTFGDLLLKEVAARVAKCLRSLDTVARFGGDEFVMLLDELANQREALAVVKRVREEIQRPFVLNSHEIQTTASFGIVLSPTNYSRPEELLQNANIAMHRAKEAGRNRIKVFSAKMLEHAVGLLIMENDLRRAVDNHEFFMEYQPILAVNDEKLLGFEALVRWNHPERGAVPPGDFISLAEETGLILPLGNWVLEEALTTMANWQASGIVPEGMTMSVNLSARQFAQPDLGDVIAGLLKKTGVAPAALKLEITESAIMENPEVGIATLNRLRKLGVQFSIDDFGTGYSSLAQLQRLPVDTLKVDRSFISRLGGESDAENCEIVRAIIALAHSLGLEVVAEGVEQQDQMCSLKDLDCECVQGFFYHRPMDATLAEELMKQLKAKK